MWQQRHGGRAFQASFAQGEAGTSSQFKLAGYAAAEEWGWGVL
jgi:hypothetical protein